MDPKPIQNLDDARLMPRFRGGGTLLEGHRMRRAQASALAAGTAANDAAREGRSRSIKAEPGDLRGIPVQARGVGGVSPGSSPTAVIDRVAREQERCARAAGGPGEPMVAFA